MDAISALTGHLSNAIASALGDEWRDADPVIRPANKKQTSADVQVNAAMALAKKVGKNPREVATAIVEALKADSAAMQLISDVEIAGPGFLNVTLKSQWIAAAAAIALPTLSTPGFARGPEAVADVAEKVIDAVVNISTSQKVEGRPGPGAQQMPNLPPGSPFEEFFEEFFKNRRGQGGGEHDQHEQVPSHPGPDIRRRRHRTQHERDDNRDRAPPTLVEAPIRTPTLVEEPFRTPTLVEVRIRAAGEPPNQPYDRDQLS